MKFRNMIATATLLAVLSFPLYAGGPPAPQAPAGQQGPGQGEGRRGGERHPAIRAAIQALERAKADLKAANHDFGGHREEALKSCDEAIKQLREALQYDKK